MVDFNWVRVWEFDNYYFVVKNKLRIMEVSLGKCIGCSVIRWFW